jgi:hypothetical protein
MLVEAEKHMTVRCSVLFNFVNMRYSTLLLLVAFFNVCFVRWSGGLQGGNVVEEKFIILVFWSYASCLSDTLKI